MFCYFEEFAHVMALPYGKKLPGRWLVPIVAKFNKILWKKRKNWNNLIQQKSKLELLCFNKFAHYKYVFNS